MQSVLPLFVSSLLLPVVLLVSCCLYAAAEQQQASLCLSTSHGALSIPLQISSIQRKLVAPYTLADQGPSSLPSDHPGGTCNMSAAVAEPATAEPAAGMDIDTSLAQPEAAAAPAADTAAAATADAAGGATTNEAAASAADGPAVAAAAADGSVPKKQTKRKVAMHLAYLGAGFHGMQRNPGCRTIETELETALTKAGAISEQNAGSFQKIHWNRAARTDKGVSALCQVVSAKLMIEPKDSFADRVNKHLPDQVRVFGVQRATDGFDARKFCDKRKYEYILPTWAFDPQAASQSRAEQQSTSKKEARKGSSSARLADEAAALQAIAAAVMAAEVPAADRRQQQQQEGQLVGGDGEGGANGVAAPAAATVAAAAMAATGEGPGSRLSSGNGGGSGQEAVHDELASTSRVGKDVLQRLRQDIATSRQRYVFGESQLQRLNSLLAQYEGTHNYHNYTIRVSAGDPAASRYILSFSAELISIEGQPWVRLVVVGQSFMLHQIRKMVGMVLAIMRGAAPEECLQLALDPDRDINTPMAPELGLFLDETYYDAYNARFGELHGPITFEPYRQAATDFKHSILYKHIAALDEKELINALWLRGCTDAYYKFSRWASQPKARDTSNLTQRQQHQLHKQQQQQHQKAANGQDNKRKQGQGEAAPAGQQQQQQPSKHQRLERPGKLDGASAAMVVGMQETYGMRPHSDTQQAAEFRRELKEMRDDYAAAQQRDQQQQQQQQQQQEQVQKQQASGGHQQAQQQQQQQPTPVVEVAEEELDSLYD